MVSYTIYKTKRPRHCLPLLHRWRAEAWPWDNDDKTMAICKRCGKVKMIRKKNP